MQIVRLVVLVVFCLGSLFSLLSVMAAEPSRDGDRPNIVFLLTDDHRADALGCMGNDRIQTPHLDQLAADGVLFTQAYVTDPTCKPSRVTYLTGQYERVHGVGFSSPHSLTEGEWGRTYPARLQASGYFTGFIGKFGVLSYYCKGNGDQLFDFWKAHDGWAKFRPTDPKYDNIREYDDYRDYESKVVTGIMEECVETFLDERDEDQPFCLSVSYSVPHGSITGTMLLDEGGDNRMTRPANSDPFMADHPIYGDLYRMPGLPVPGDATTDQSRFIPLDVMAYGPRQKCYSYAYTMETNAEHQIRYYQLVTGMDQAVGRLRTSLEERGLAENTVIVFSSDHGLLMGEYGMGGKGLLYDLTTHIPFIVSDPRAPEKQRGVRDESFVISADVAPTILDLAGLAPSDYGVEDPIEGRSLVPLLYGEENPVSERESVFLENMYIGRDTPFTECVRNREWKYVRFYDPSRATYQDADLQFNEKTPDFEQLFDLKNDPGERTNLIDAVKDDPSLSAVLEELRDACRERSAKLMQQREAYGAK
jgi:arylsulfatase A-like enzyme